MNILLNEYFRFKFWMNIELNRFWARFNVWMNFQIVSPRAISNPKILLQIFPPTKPNLNSPWRREVSSEVPFSHPAALVPHPGILINFGNKLFCLWAIFTQTLRFICEICKHSSLFGRDAVAGYLSFAIATNKFGPNKLLPSPEIKRNTNANI